MMGVPGKKADNCMVAEKQREERLGSNMTDFLPLGPTSSKFYAFLLIVPQAGDQAFNTGTLGIFKIQSLVLWKS
jgi:hypothetical protein